MRLKIVINVRRMAYAKVTVDVQKYINLSAVTLGKAFDEGGASQ